METLKDMLDNLHNMRFPGGISTKDISIHVEVAEDAAHNVIQFLRYYYNDEELDISNIRLNKDFPQRLDRSIKVLTELRQQKKWFDELARELICALRTK